MILSNIRLKAFNSASIVSIAVSLFSFFQTNSGAGYPSNVHVTVFEVPLAKVTCESVLSVGAS